MRGTSAAAAALQSRIIALFSLLTAVTCLATPVQTSDTGTTIVRAGPFVGRIAPGYDVVDGRFSLHVGAYRVPHGLSQKILWSADPGAPVGDALVLTARRLTKPVRRFTQTFPRATSPTDPDTVWFPSIVAPPRAGCWRFTLRSGPSVATLTVLVRRA